MKVVYQILCIFLTLGTIQTAFSETRLVDPEWSFSDEFEGSENRSFWASTEKSNYGVSCDNSSNSSKVMDFHYIPGSNSWAEKRFNIPVNAQQLEISYDLYIPANYIHAPSNHKNFVLWSGTYGKSASNISVSSENWPVSGGVSPSVYIGVDGVNYEHSSIPSKPIMWHDKHGSWVKMHIFLELAEREGDYGVFEIHRNGEYLTGTHHPEISPSWGQPATNTHISYSSRGNFIDQGYLLGWANGGVNGGVGETAIFCVDNFSIKANSTHSATTAEGEINPPLPPTNTEITITE